MNLATILRGVRRYWRQALVLGALLGVVTALFSFLTTKPSYIAQNSMLFQVADLNKVSDPSTASNYATQLVTSYSSMGSQQVVLAPVAAQMTPPVDMTTLSGKVTVSAPRSNLVVLVQTTDSDQAKAEQIVTLVGKRLAQLASQSPLASDGTTHQVRVQSQNVSSIQDPASKRSLVGSLLKGVLVGLLVFLIWMLARALLDTRVRDHDDLADVTDASLLGSVPAGDAEGDGAYQALARALPFLRRPDRPGSLVVAGVAGGDDAGQVAARTAAAAAAAGSRVLVVDADLRRGVASQALGVHGPGLAEYLSGQATLDAVRQSAGEGRPSVIGAGTLPPNPAELLATPAMARLLAEPPAGFDQVIISGAPLLPSSDSAILASDAGGVAVVVRAGDTRRGQLDEALSLLESSHAQVQGVVLTNAPARNVAKA